MDKSKVGFKEESTQTSQGRDDSLVISINSAGKIIQFNKKCEKVTGYSRKQALNKEIFDFLIPNTHFEDWNRLFNLARQNKSINDLELPWLSRDGTEIMISWSSYLVDEIEGDSKDICLIGKQIISDDDHHDTEPSNTKGEKGDKKSILKFIKGGLSKKGDVNKKKDVTERKSISIGLGNKRIIIKETDTGDSKDIVQKETKKVTPKVKKVSTKSQPEVPEKPLETVKTEEIGDDKELDEFINIKDRKNKDVHKSIKELEKRNEKLEKENKKLEQNLISKKTGYPVIKKDKTFHKTVDVFRDKTSNFLSFLGGIRKNKEFDKMIPEKKKESIYKTIKKIEKRNEKLENENKKLELYIKDLNIRISDIEKDKITHETSYFKPVESKTSAVIDSISSNKKQEDADYMTTELEERKNLLDDIETQLTKEKAEINEQKNEFRKWREKLEFLEEEIEKRRVELINQENEFKDRLITSPAEKIPYKSIPEQTKEIQNVTDDTLDDISESAAIVKRGILKQVNQSFVELLGYDINMLLEKSLLDFIAPEGISGIEEYYLRRLKGGVVSDYETVFLTKNNDKMFVRINIKPTTFDGEKAEIAVIKILDKKEDNKNLK